MRRCENTSKDSDKNVPKKKLYVLGLTLLFIVSGLLTAWLTYCCRKMYLSEPEVYISFKLQYDINSENNYSTNHWQIFYVTDGNKKKHDSQQIWTKNSRIMTFYERRLPCHELNRIRFDFGANPKNFILDQIKLMGDKTITLEDMKMVSSAQVEDLKLHPNRLTGRSSQKDPHVWFELKPPLKGGIFPDYCTLSIIAVPMFVVISASLMFVYIVACGRFRPSIENIKKIAKKIYGYSLIYIILIAVFLSLLVFAAALPHTREFKSKIGDSDSILARRGYFPDAAGTTVDHFTECWILNVAYSLDPGHPFYSSLQCPYYQRKNISQRLLDITSGKYPDVKKAPYERYWFGQGAVVKILHYFCNIDKIHIFFGSLFLFLALTAVLYAYKTNGVVGAFSLFILLGLCNYHVFTLTVQFPPVICIGLAGMIWLCRSSNVHRGFVFFILGMLTAYFDLLTAPILAFGIPALFICGKDFMQLSSSEQRKWKNWFLIWCGCPVAWLSGYILSWGTKVLLASLFVTNFKRMCDAIFLRSGAAIPGLGRIPRWYAVEKNFTVLYNNTQLVLLLIVVVMFISLIVKLYYWKKQILFFNWRLFCGYLTLVIMPLLTILLMANHSYIHAWMTYRGLSMTCTALFMSLTSFQTKMENKHD